MRMPLDLPPRPRFSDGPVYAFARMTAEVLQSSRPAQLCGVLPWPGRLRRLCCSMYRGRTGLRRRPAAQLHALLMALQSKTDLPA
jgi:hypothetical protein